MQFRRVGLRSKVKTKLILLLFLYSNYNLAMQIGGRFLLMGNNILIQYNTVKCKMFAHQSSLLEDSVLNSVFDI